MPDFAMMTDTATPVLQAAQDLTPLYYLIGSSVVAQLIAAGFGIVQWLGRRNIDHDDKEKQKLEDRVTTLENARHEQDKEILSLKNGAGTTTNLLNETRSDFTSLRSFLDERFEKQAKAFQASMDKLEYQLRTDTTRAIHDAQLAQQTRKKRA